jgi:hypothetical protein
MKTNDCICAQITEDLNDRFEHAKMHLKLKTGGSDRLGYLSPDVLIESKEDEEANVDTAIKTWAAENAINLVEITEENGIIENLWETATEGYLTKSYLRTTKDTFNMLNTPNTVLYFKRIDKMSNKLFRTRLMRFMNNQSVTFGDGKVYFAKNILFSILTISNEMDKYDYRELENDSKDGFEIFRLSN